MRKDLTAALTEVGASPSPHASAEVLVKLACTLLTGNHRTVTAMLRQQVGWHAAVRGALIRAGRDPGAHALLSDMLAELVAVADGRLVR